MDPAEVATARLVLPPVPQSAGSARRFCAQQLADLDGDQLDTVSLLVSELVTNAVLHALTEIEVTVSRSESWLQVGVQDRSPLVPTPREYGAVAVTGRGLGLVELLADEYGIEPHPGGKAVWFTLRREGRQPGPPSSPPVALDAAPSPSPAAAADDVRVLLRGLPVMLYRVLQEQNDALLREYALLHLSGSSDPAQSPDPLPRPDIAAAERAQARLAGAVAAGAALGTGEHRDVAFAVPRAQLGDFEQLRAVLGEAVRLAARGRLLARPALPELRALRTWCLDQVAAAATGAPGAAWVGTEEVADDDLALPLPAFDAAALDPEVAMLAADDGNRILAVTGPAAALLGWQPDELVGHRLVAIIPRRLREAHLASFTRLLLSGQPRLLGQPLQLPALRRDGSEVELQIVITSVPAGPGRLVFLAELTADLSPGT